MPGAFLSLLVPFTSLSWQRLSGGLPTHMDIGNPQTTLWSQEGCREWRAGYHMFSSKGTEEMSASFLVSPLKLRIEKCL